MPFIVSLLRRTPLYPAYKGTKALVATARARFGVKILPALRNCARFLRDYRALSRAPNGAYELSPRHWVPCLTDWTACTPVDPIYFHQDCWAAGHVLRRKPARHVDVGSHVPTVGIIAECVPTTFVDIRPIPVQRPGLTFLEGSILSLPFEDASVESLSSICVIEHVGLGRYGDPLDPFGTEKAAGELSRVLAPGGDLYVSVPIDSGARVYFNGHRAFTPDLVCALFQDLKLAESRFIYGLGVAETYDAARGFGTGLFHFRKP